MSRGRSRGAAWLALGALSLMAVPARAHDFWIEPTTWQPGAGELVRLSLLVGDDFSGEEVPREAAYQRRFVARSCTGIESQDVLGFEGRAPAGFLRFEAEGLQAVAFESLPRHVVLEPRPFHRYLIEEGLESILEERMSLREGEEPGRERFVRCAKSLVQVDSTSTEGHDRPLGLTFEIVPLDDPFREDEVRFQILYHGQPLEGALVVARSRDGEGSDPALPPVAQRTDAQGMVRLKLTGGGAWLVKSVHMGRLASPSGEAPPSTEGNEGNEGVPRADWESHWASLTFCRPAR